jgi:succinylglutamate desuccinylase
MLTELDYLPDGLLQVEARELYTILPGPTLIHLPGRRDIPLFVSILLHGNEDTGLKAMQTAGESVGL